ncbi:dihydrofolate reductase family protein [Pseudonocardia sp. GCM10023141]|uniref:dihydrofolate reductase family protein n=1 Tax=Pseudonocardia sp. GCM10023141 TaxID=3252653 RepID=UPI0036149194
MTSTNSTRRAVVGNISLSLDGRVNGPGGDYDMGWVVPHAITDGARDHMMLVTTGATTALLGRKNYEGFGGFWPAVADSEQADPRDRAFSRWLTNVEKVVFTSATELSWQHSRRAGTDAVTAVKQLREQDGGDIVVLASSSVIKALLDADELDRLSITLCPEVAGGGMRLFEDGLPSTSWTLTHSAPTESGAIGLLYDRVRD